jgi:hypothetical protein
MQWDDNVFLLLKGSYAGGAGIEKRKYFSLSSIERTLIDLTVRPAYGGGSVTILEIYKKAIRMCYIKCVRPFYISAI